jgi:hypothetical protein
MSPSFEILSSIVVTHSADVYSTDYIWALHLVVGGIFDKIVPILEAAEKKWLKAGAVAHCGNIKGFVGLFALDLVPRPDLLVTSGFLCEAAPKTIDLLHELYGIPIISFDTCQDRSTGCTRGDRAGVALASVKLPGSCKNRGGSGF